MSGLLFSARLIDLLTFRDEKLLALMLLMNW